MFIFGSAAAALIGLQFVVMTLIAVKPVREKDTLWLWYDIARS